MAKLPERGDRVAGKYRVERELGRGGNGVVYLAHHLVTDKPVALKWMVPRPDATADDMQRFIREARAAARIQHPHVVDIYDLGEHAGSIFLVMEYLLGVPLSRAMTKGALPAGELLHTLLPVIDGLHTAHRSGVVHRDLKPDNIFLRASGEGEPQGAKVLDFGISKVQDVPGGATTATLTEAGTVMGTPHYMAPEQAEDPRGVDARADIYSLGVILYHALSGQRPFEAESLTALLLQITRGQVRPLSEACPELPAALCDAVMKAMARKPAERFSDARELMRALEPFAGDAPLRVAAEGQGADGDGETATASEDATPFGTVSAATHGARRASLWRVGLAAVGLLVIGGAAAWLIHEPSEAPAPTAIRTAQPVLPAPAAAPMAVQPPSAPAEAAVGTRPMQGTAGAVSGESRDAAPTRSPEVGEALAPARAPASPRRATRPKRARSTGAIVPTSGETTPAGSAPAESAKGRLGIELDPAQF